MKLSGSQLTFKKSRHIIAAVLAAIFIFAPGIVLAANKGVHEADRAESRSKEMHSKLKITPAQEDLWTKVDQAMRDDAKIMDGLTQERVDHAKVMTAIDDLKSYGELAEAHAEGIKNLTPLFADLYASLSDEQKKEADTLFRNGYHGHGNHKHSHKKASDK
jgi:periplasmic protein CpxP/Spy